MKGKRTFAYLALLCLLIALAMPLAAAADGCPPENPNCNIEPPQSIEVNPDPLHADGSPVELPEPGALSPQIVPMPLPRSVDPLPLPAGDASSFETLPIPLRLQDPADVSCGVQALGMALEGLDGSAPSSAALLSFLEDNGMMYDFGTGVEELAYAAQSLGYKGSLPFHDWTLEDLQAELSEGRPVVVSLGANGEGNPGHFVTVTGVSGGQVAYNDPTLGKQVISIEEFLRLWSMQGNSGVLVRAESPLPGLDLMPWVAFLASLMALITQTPLVRWRRGIGGRLDPGIGTAIPAKSPSKPPVYVPRPRPVHVAPAAQPPAPEPAPVEPITEEDRLTSLEEKLLDPVIPPEPTPEEAKLTHLEPQLDPVIPPKPTREEIKLAAILRQEPVMRTNAGEADRAQQLQGPDPSPEEPELVPVPSILIDPVGWFQATMINLGRTNEDAREVMTATLAPTAEFLLEVGEFRADAADFMRRSLEGWGQAGEGFATLLNYSWEAVSEGISDTIDDALQQYEELPFLAKLGVGFAPGGDVIDIIREGRKLTRGEGVDGVVLGLAALGLVLDLGWADGLIPDPVDGANAVVSFLKNLLRLLPQGPAREAVEQMIRNPDQWGRLAETVEELTKHADELSSLDSPELIVWLLNKGPDGIEYLVRHGEDAANAIRAAERLAEVGRHSDEAAEILDTILDASIHGSGDNVVIGRYFAEGEGYGYIQHATDHGGIYFDTPEGLYDTLGRNDELMLTINQGFLRRQLESGVSRIELVGEAIDDVLDLRPTSFTAREIEFLMDEAPKFGYELQGNMWVFVGH